MATPQTSAGPVPSEFACRLLVSGTNWPTCCGCVGSLRSIATMPFEYQEEYARSPSTSVLCTDQQPGGVGNSSYAGGEVVDVSDLEDRQAGDRLAECPRGHAGTELVRVVRTDQIGDER